MSEEQIVLAAEISVDAGLRPPRADGRRDRHRAGAGGRRREAPSSGGGRRLLAPRQIDSVAADGIAVLIPPRCQQAKARPLGLAKQVPRARYARRRGKASRGRHLFASDEEFVAGLDV